MAKMESMIPLILNREIGLKDNEWNLPPRKMYESVSQRGFHIVKGDNGGPTMCGVTIATFTDWRKRQGKGTPTVNDLRALRYDEWLAILKNLFWNPCKADQIKHDSIAIMLVDWRWVNGTQAIRDAQFALGCVSDGIVGKNTLAALNAPDSLSVFNRLKNARLRSYDKIVAKNKNQMVFYKGWVNRTNSIEYRE